MKNEVITFNNEEFGSVRCMSIDNEPWFVGKDVATVLGYSNSSKAIQDHVDEEHKGVTKSDTLGGKQNMTIINESGLDDLILRSRRTSAKQFKNWITNEVLPSLNKSSNNNDSEPYEQHKAALVKVENNEVLVLVDAAERPEDIDVNRAKRAADEAREALLQQKSRQEYKRAQANLARAISRLRVRERWQN